MRMIFLLVTIPLISLGGGCDRPPPKSTASTPVQPKGASHSDEHDHAEGDDHAKEGEKPAGGHGGAVIELGTTTLNGMNLRASRDAGELKAGGDAPIDLWIDGGLGSAAVVRFWIGTEDAKGAMKAKAEIEDGKWHSHTEVPDPLPQGSKLWVEIEGKDGKKTVASFELQK